MTVIPWPYRLLALVLLAAALIGFGWIKGAEHVQARWDAAVQQQTLHAATVRQKQAEATVKVVTQYVDRVRVVREKGDTIIKEVPVYVPVQADAACTRVRQFRGKSVGFRRAPRALVRFSGRLHGNLRGGTFSALF